MKDYHREDVRVVGGWWVGGGGGGMGSMNEEMVIR